MGSWSRMCLISTMDVEPLRQSELLKMSKKIPIAGVPPPSVGRNCGKLPANGNLDRNRGIPQRPQRTSFGSKSSLWNQWKSAFLQRASEEAPTRRQPEFPRREHAHDVETQVGGAMRHFRSRLLRHRAGGSRAAPHS